MISNLTTKDTKFHQQKSRKILEN